ncbi:MAG: nitrous oxide reductase family maturation protein NosD [Gracilimonas sp.]
MSRINKYRLLVFSFALMLFSLSYADAFSQQKIIYVETDGPVNTLEKAVTLADSGDVIHITPGIHPVQKLLIEKSITLQGEEGAVIDIGSEGFGIVVMGENINLKGFEIKDSGYGFMEDFAAILIEDSRNVVVDSVRLTNNFFGVYIAKSEKVTITNNKIFSNAVRQTKSGNGVHIWYSKNVEVHNNTIRGHRDGIYLEFVETSLITKNHVEGNIRYGLHFMYSNNCTYIDNQFQNNLTGVAVMYSKNVVMQNNRFLENWGANRYGLLLKEINDSKVISNEFRKNTVGIYSEASNRIEISSNQFEENGTALRMMANGVDSRITSNNFIANTFEVTTNSRQNPNHYNGNYWSQYEGYDMDRDGVGDVPYRPVRLFSILAERQSIALVMMRSMLVDLLDTVERIIPAMTPKNLIDEEPQMSPIE